MNEAAYNLHSLGHSPIMVTSDSSDWVDAETGPATTTGDYPALAVYGLPGYRFYLVHYTALVALAFSITCSACTFTYLTYPCKSGDFYKRSIGMIFLILSA